MKNWVKYLIFGTVLVFAIAFISIRALSSNKPKGKSGIAADALALKIEDALGKSDFDDLRFIRWNFMDAHSYIWDKNENKCIVGFDDTEVLLDLNDYKAKSIILSDGNLYTSEQKPDITENAYAYFCNDSFWLIAPFKFFDKGAERYLVKQNEKSKLLVQFSNGGVTPGDAYLWTLDDTNKPERVHMWTSNLPIEGMQFCWDDYKSFKNNGNLKIALSHKFIKLLNIKTNEIEIGNSLEDIKAPNDSFKKFSKA